MTQPVDNVRTPGKQWRYFVADPTKQSWGAVIYLDSSGVFVAYSDYGTYGYRWTDPGHDDIREFFLRSKGDCEYFRRKFCPGEHFAVDETTKAIRARIRQMRRERRISADDARRESKLANFSNEVEAYANWYAHTNLDDACDLVRHEPSQQAIMFCKTIMPALAQIIRTELDAERQQVASG